MKKNILVADDSALMRRVICDIINSDEKFQVTDVCRDGLEAYEKLTKQSYDAVLLDVYMPRMSGLQLLERLRDEHIKATVVMVSTLTTKDAAVTMQAMELGAVDFVTKPQNIIEAKGKDFRNALIDMLEAVLHTETVRRQMAPAASVRAAGMVHQPLSRKGQRLVALACSTGGPKALHSVIPFLDPKMDAPMIVVQHMPQGFTQSLAERLNALSKVQVKEATEGDILQKGKVYIAPGGKHMEIVYSGGMHKVHLSSAPPIGGLRPCANVTYESLINSQYDDIVCVVLTGMGADGTEGIKKLDQKKPLHVIAQNAQTCVVYGMPRAIAEAGLVDEVVPLESIANTIMKNVGVK